MDKSAGNPRVLFAEQAPLASADERWYTTPCFHPSRSVAQPGSAFASGAKGRGSKSLRSDQSRIPRYEISGIFLFPLSAAVRCGTEKTERNENPTHPKSHPKSTFDFQGISHVSKSFAGSRRRGRAAAALQRARAHARDVGMRVAHTFRHRAAKEGRRSPAAAARPCGISPLAHSSVPENSSTSFRLRRIEPKTLTG